MRTCKVHVRENPMKYIFSALCTATALAMSAPSLAALQAGDPAPDFTVPAALAGEAFEFSLQQALKQGPVVLYFYPAAFTKGCTVEARSFAEAIDDYKALNASVIGISGDDIGTLKAFSVEGCSSKFAVGADDDGSVIRAYDAELGTSTGRADRISYVISPEGRIVYAYSSMNPDQHVGNTLDALRKWREKAGR